MPSVKERMTEIIRSQPDDSSCDEILRALLFDRTIERGLHDSQNGRVISNDDMKKRIQSWQK